MPNGRIRSAPRRPLRAAAVLAAISLLAACGGGGDDGGGGGDATGTTAEGGTPVAGGTLVYGLEAETTGGFCLPGSQLAVAGAQVANAVYDPLVWPDEDGEIKPYLAKSVTPNDDATEWTITLREGVTFHDGAALDAEAVKLNLDSYRGKNPDVSAPLFSFVFAPIADVAVVDPLTVKVTMNRPWAAFDAALFGGLGRVGMVAPSQLADKEGCARKLVGTGPFRFREWVPNDHLTVVKNPDYWREGLPYLDEITFRPVTDGTQRVNALQAGQLDAAMSDSGNDLDRLEQLADAGTLRLSVSDQSAEVGYTLLNSSSPPFDDVRARRIVALATDVAEINTITNKGRFELAKGPFAENVVGYVADPGFPEHDVEAAKELLAAYTADKGPLRFTLLGDTDPITLQRGQLAQQQLREVGIQVELRSIEQSQLINEALGGKFQAIQWRNHPGGDPDTQYVWWHSASPVNFGRIKDAEVDRLLDEGRASTDDAARARIYQDLTRRFGEQVYNVWSWYVQWGVATKPDVRGVAGPELPDGGTPQPSVAGMHPTVGIWRAR